MKMVQQYYHKNKVFIWGLTIIYVLHIGYLLNSTTNIPLMDYWTYIYEFTDKIFMGNISCSDIWSNFTAHRAPFQYVCFFLNMKFFTGNTLVSVYLASLVTLITNIYIYSCCRRNIQERDSIVIQVGAVLISFGIFTLNRWEIITLEFSFAFAVRILLFVVIFDLIDKICHQNEKCLKMIGEIGVFIFVTILFFSSSYFPAMVLTIAIIMVLTLFSSEIKDRKRFFKTCCIIGGFALSATIIYMYHLNTGTKLSLSFLFRWIFGWGAKGVLLMMAASLKHINDFNDRSIYFGGIVILIYIVSFIIYYKKRLYKLTYLPIMLMIYSIASMIIISYARVEMFDISYVTSSRYTYETTLGVVGMIWIQMLSYTKDIANGLKKTVGRKHILSMCIILFISANLIIVEHTERKMAVYRKAYMQNLQEIAYNIEDYSDEELAGFQANQPEYVRSGIEKLKKYKLSIFKYN